MNALVQWQQDIARLQELIDGSGWHRRAASQLAAFEPVHLSVAPPEDFADPAGVFQRLAAGQQLQGWLTLTDRHVVLPLESLPETVAYPLGGEGRDSDGYFRLQYLGVGCWRWWRYTVRPAAVEDATHLADRAVHLGTEQAPGNLEYLRLWKLLESDAQAGQPSVELALFDGFSGLAHD